MIRQVISALLAVTIALTLRVHFVLPRHVRPLRKKGDKCTIAIFLGSGLLTNSSEGNCGHTSEALTLVSALDFSRYVHRIYVIAAGDTLSAQKAMALEKHKARPTNESESAEEPSYTLITIPRARRVHQTILTTPYTALYSLIACLYHTTIKPRLSGRRTFADALLLNGPGTCFILAVSTYVNRILGLPSPTLIYVESFARVRSLSLSGKLLRPLVDRFVVQWPNLMEVGAEYHGWLV
ncbi:glycosyltransferase family 1 protein [Athelia psychrophila]|uniref:UDP-N-acetylglucosamine transferase subunit ALG14 n=1 Tax=Athelia psychrophila TaxID=1759441 RepID=A0A166XBL3_9AGAM|nr:glycosyltransferase family 1 protein [Fibularhizoctonia sp. CBS 109695]